MSQKKKSDLFYGLLVIGLATLITVAIVLAWQEPTQAPPGGNVSAPINVGNTTQYKEGGLRIGGAFQSDSIGVFNSGLKISNSPLQESGVIRWTGADFQGYTGSSWLSLTAGGLWVATGTSIYNANTGNVGIGTTMPNERLTIGGVLSLKETITPSETPGYGKLYVKEGRIYFKDQAGNNTDIITPYSGTAGDNYLEGGHPYFCKRISISSEGQVTAENTINTYKKCDNFKSCCNGSCEIDKDQDSYSVSCGDCNDNDNRQSPNPTYCTATSSPDGIDWDCNGQPDNFRPTYTFGDPFSCRVLNLHAEESTEYCWRGKFIGNWCVTCCPSGCWDDVDSGGYALCKCNLDTTDGTTGLYIEGNMWRPEKRNVGGCLF